MSIGCAVETLQVHNHLKPTYPVPHIQESTRINLPMCILYDSNIDVIARIFILAYVPYTVFPQNASCFY